MSHRLSSTLLCTLAFAAFPAAAAAQTAPDERANARAFADVGVRLAAEGDAAVAGIEFFGPRCRSIRRLAKATPRQQSKAYTLIGAQIFGMLGRALNPVLDRAMTDLNAIPTADPALQGGREAWGTIAHLYRVASRFKHVRLCRELRNYVRGGFRSTPAMHRANRLERRLARMNLDKIDRQMADAVDRLVELGVPADEADLFDGGDDSGAGYARAGQAPAPSSPLKLLRAAS